MPKYALLFILAVVFTTPRPLPAQQPMNHFPSHTLQNGDLTMTVNLPDPEKGSYRGTRFDWSGILTSLTWKGHEYFGYWKAFGDPMVHDDITGPAESFWKPGLNYEEAKPGEGFVRIGVGVLEKPDEEGYQSFNTYPVLDHGEWKVEKKSDRITFTQRLQTDFGYAYTYTKEIRLSEEEPGFVIAHSLTNSGSRAIETDQYNHNFFMIDGETTGPNMELDFPFPVSTESDLKDIVRIEGTTFHFPKTLQEGETVFLELEGYGDSPAHHGFTMRNTRTGAGVRMQADHPLERFTFWCRNTTICPENALLVRVAPGQTVLWEAAYTLFAP